VEKIGPKMYATSLIFKKHLWVNSKKMGEKLVTLFLRKGCFGERWKKIGRKFCNGRGSWSCKTSVFTLNLLLHQSSANWKPDESLSTIWVQFLQYTFTPRGAVGPRGDPFVRSWPLRVNTRPLIHPKGEHTQLFTEDLHPLGPTSLYSKAVYSKALCSKAFCLKAFCSKAFLFESTLVRKHLGRKRSGNTGW
jgi:hypothetical protein